MFNFIKAITIDDESSSSNTTRCSRDRARRDLSKQMNDSSTDTDYDDRDSNYGPTTRRAWSDWCSNKGKSSQSEEEMVTKVRNYRTVLNLIFFELLIINCKILLKARRQSKKLRRKISRGGKSQNQQKSAAGGGAKARRGRVKKGKPKKAIKINGLDLLHSQTLLSTSPQGKLNSNFYYNIYDDLMLLFVYMY